MKPASDHTGKAVEAIERTPTRDDRGHELLDGPHGCSDGWKLNENGEAYPCPECSASREEARVQRELQEAGVGERYWTTTWSDMEMVEPMSRVKAACDRITTVLESGDHLLLSGEPGTGKTQAAVLLIRAAIQAGKTAKLLNLGRAGMEIRAAYGAKQGPTESSEIKAASTPDLLVIDDLGAGETGNATLEQRILYLALEERQNTRRTTVLTTNLTGADVAERLGQRLIGRLQPLAVFRFEHGRNFRKPSGKTAWESK